MGREQGSPKFALPQSQSLAALPWFHGLGITKSQHTDVHMSMSIQFYIAALPASFFPPQYSWTFSFDFSHSFTQILDVRVPISKLPERDISTTC